MLLNDNDNKEKTSDFDEINNDFSTINSINNYALTTQKNQENELPRKARLILFLIGFSYTGLLIISLFWSSIAPVLFSTDSEINIAIEFGTYATLLIAFICVCIRYRKYFVNELKQPYKYICGIICGIGIIIAEIIVSTLMAILFPSDINSNQEIINTLMNDYPTLMVIITVFMGPICEELTYRVGLYGLLREKNETLGFILSGFIFAFVHLSFIGTDIVAELSAFPVYLTISYLFNLTYKKFGFSGSLLAHMLINTISILGIVIGWKNY